jgi:hypothetical protein
MYFVHGRAGACEAVPGSHEVLEVIPTRPVPAVFGFSNNSQPRFRAYFSRVAPVIG